MVLGIAGLSSAGLLLFCAPVQAGAAEMAVAELRPVAAVLAGESMINVGQDADGLVRWTYGPQTAVMSEKDHTSAVDDHARLEVALRRAKVDIWTGYLVKAADTDASGETSVAEARTLRHDIEVAFLARQLGQAPTIGQLAQLLHEDSQRVSSSLMRYRKLFQKAVSDKMMGLPELPERLLGAA